ncbi:MAG: hypothetical protein ABEJ28_07930 [Salinigranum sp.]
MGDPPDKDSLFELLSNSRRRHTMRCLKEHATMTLADVAEEIAVRERATTIDKIDAESVQDVYHSLYHVHVPKLERADLVIYDQEQDLVGLTEEGMEVKLQVHEMEDVLANFRDTENKITVGLSKETIEAIHNAIESDERFDPHQAYDEIIYTIVSEAYSID